MIALPAAILLTSVLTGGYKANRKAFKPKRHLQNPDRISVGVFHWIMDDASLQFSAFQARE